MKRSTGGRAVRRAPATLILCLTLFTSAAFAQSDSLPPPFPPPGDLVDIGGWRLHLHCSGQDHASQPTVILEAGAW